MLEPPQEPIEVGALLRLQHAHWGGEGLLSYSLFASCLDLKASHLSQILAVVELEIT